MNDYSKILADLQNLDVEILDEDKALLLLNYLPDTYDHLITTLLYGKNEIKFDDVSNALMNNEYRRRISMPIDTHMVKPYLLGTGLIVGNQRIVEANLIPNRKEPFVW